MVARKTCFQHFGASRLQQSNPLQDLASLAKVKSESSNWVTTCTFGKRCCAKPNQMHGMKLLHTCSRLVYSLQKVKTAWLWIALALELPGPRQSSRRSSCLT